MAFDYQTLKQIRNDAFISQTLTGSDVGTTQITTALFASGTLTATQLGSGSVDQTSSVVTGTTPYNKGGTGMSSMGGAYQLLATNSSGNGLTFANHGIYRMVVFTGSGTYYPTGGVRYVWVQVQGAGGGAGGHGESGAAGGYAEKIVSMVGVGSVSVYVGGGGGGTYYNNAGGNGDYAGFGPYVSASGGHGCNRHNNHNGGLSGNGSGGDFNIHTGSGGGHEQRSSGMGGSSFWGGPAPAGHPQGGHFSHIHQGHSAPGTGGTSGHFSGHRGSDGRPGLVVITEFF
jgi:hypothetical protein